MYYFLVFIFGLAIGSFLNVIIYRLDKKASAFEGRSRCPKCRKHLKWYDNIPLVSFALLRGRCRNCHKKISWQYPIVELATASAFLINAIVLVSRPQLITADVEAIFSLLTSFLFTSFLIVIFVYDLNKYQILDKVSIPLIITALVLNLFFYSFWNLILAGLIGFAFFGLQYLISGGKWIGDGDIRLGLAMGLMLGYPKVLIGLFLAYLIGSLVAVGLIIFSKKNMKSRIPFGPFLAGATYLIFLFGDYLLKLFI